MMTQMANEPEEIAAPVKCVEPSGFDGKIEPTDWPRDDSVADPMLLETLRGQGCVDLRYPIWGSVEFVPTVDVEL